MKTLSIKNPWGYLIAAGIKDIENRSWPIKYRGQIFIHASQKWDSRAWSLRNIFTKKQLETIDIELSKKIINQSVPVSAIIGTVEIVDCIQNGPSIWAEKGQWHWVLKNPKLFEKPILNVKGKLGLWDYQLITPDIKI